MILSNKTIRFSFLFKHNFNNKYGSLTRKYFNVVKIYSSTFRRPLYAFINVRQKSKKATVKVGISFFCFESF